MLNKQEIEAFKAGSLNIRLIDGNIYKFLAEREYGYLIEDVNYGYLTFRTKQELMSDPTIEPWTVIF